MASNEAAGATQSIVVSRARLSALTAAAMVAFAANSVLCRLALKSTRIDPATFTSIRLVSGALMLALIMLARKDGLRGKGNWFSAAALFAYAAAFAFAYIGLSAGAGALLLFTAVQTTMLLHALRRGERLAALQWFGFAVSLSGLVALLLPGITAPPLTSAVLMLGAGIAWGIYSIRGRGCADPAGETAANFARSLPMTATLSALLLLFKSCTFDGIGALYAVLSGAMASGLGYAIWYSALRGLSGTSAAVVQLSVPVLAALGGVAFLGEAITLRLVLTSIAILGGIGMVVVRRQPART
jgi:drug/metabolite transporter (DMT)-like permease